MPVYRGHRDWVPMHRLHKIDIVVIESIFVIVFPEYFSVSATHSKPTAPKALDHKIETLI